MPRIIAILLIVLGLAGACFAFSMAINAPGTNIANLSLMAERQNILLVSAVLVLVGTIFFAADYVRGGKPLTTPAQRTKWFRLLAIGAVISVLVVLGIHRQNEALAFGPFWILIAWQVWKARFRENCSPIATAAIVLALSAVSLICVFIFFGVGEPALPVSTFVGSELAVKAKLVDYHAAFDKWAAQHMPILNGIALAQAVVLTGSTLLLIFLGVRRSLAGRKAPPNLELSEPSS